LIVGWCGRFLFFVVPRQFSQDTGDWPENQILIPDWTYFHCPGTTLVWRLKKTMPLAEKMKFPVGIGSGHFSLFLSADNVYFSLVAGSTLTDKENKYILHYPFFIVPHSVTSSARKNK